MEVSWRYRPFMASIWRSGVRGAFAVDHLGGRDERIDRFAQRLDDGLEEQLVLALEVPVDDTLADAAALGDGTDGGAVHVAGLGEGAPGGFEDRGSCGPRR